MHDSPFQLHCRILKNSIAYPIRLLKTILNLISNKLSISIYTESERNTLFPEFSGKKYIPQIIENTTENSVKANVILKRHPAASFLTDEEYPADIIWKEKEKYSDSFFRSIFLALFLFLIAAVFIMENKLKNENRY